MSVPKFGDVGKRASDLFNDDFGASNNVLTLKSKTLNGTNLKVEGTHSNANGSVAGVFEAKYNHKPSGLTIKEKWNTKNVVTCDVTAKPKNIPNSEITLSGVFAPNGGGLQNLTAKTQYMRPHFTANVDVNFNNTVASTVFGNFDHLPGWVLGVQSLIKHGGVAPSSTKFALGYETSDLSVTSFMTGLNHITGQVFHQPTKGVQAGLKFGWDGVTNDTTFAVAGKYTLDSHSFAKVSLDKNLVAGLSFVQTVKPGVTLRLSADIDGRKPSDAHRVGFQLTLEN